MTQELSARYRQIMQKVISLSGARSHKVTVIAVSKKQTVEAIQTIYDLGHRDFGENYVQELVEKAKQLQSQGCESIRWHFIGHLQTNKVKSLVRYVHSVHSVDTLKLAQELAKRWREVQGESAPPLPIFIEVNLDQEPNKSGVLPENVATLAAQIAQISPTGALSLQGLMAIPAANATATQTSAAFARLRELESKCRPHTQGQLSMGMSSDYELAIGQGATHVRIGTSLFGERPTH